MTTQVYTTQAEQLAGFVVRTYYDELSLAARLQLKIRTLAAWLLPRLLGILVLGIYPTSLMGLIQTIAVP